MSGFHPARRTWMNRMHGVGGATAAAALLAGGLATSAMADRTGGGDRVESGRPPIELLVDNGPKYNVEFTNTTLSTNGQSVETDGGIAGPGCPPIFKTHSSHTFASGTPFAAQAGFVEQEIAAAEYQVTALETPLTIRTMEFLLGTPNPSQQITVQYTILIWSGNPETGTLLDSFSSDNVILPHAVLNPPTNGLVVSITVDPQDPDQLVIPEGATSFTIGIRFDQMQNDSGGICGPHPANLNMFPTTDQTCSGSCFSTGCCMVAQPTRNWLFIRPGCTLTGWHRFSELSLLSPSGDWNIRATIEPSGCVLPTAACCLPDGQCTVLEQNPCLALNGSWNQAEADCIGFTCPAPLGACCVPSTQGCATVTQANCPTAIGAVWHAGEDCESYICFPIGACCIPSTGQCIASQTPTQCQTAGGVFQGHQTVCNAGTCPMPTGACCGPGFCVGPVTENTCDAFGGSWKGYQTACTNGSGTGPECLGTPCPEDVNNDNVVGIADLLAVIGDWNEVGDQPTDIDNSNVVGIGDLLAVIGAWGPC